MFQRFSILSLTTLNIFLLSVLLMQACRKDAIPSDNAGLTTLTIEEAKQFFASKTASSTPQAALVVPDWDHAVSYFDEVKQQSVVEMPLLGDPVSRTLINPENVPVDLALLGQNTPHHRLVIVKDAQGVTGYAIMKIVGTYRYALERGAASENTYRKMDSQFEGMVRYVDIDDQIQQSYYMTDGRYYEIKSIKTVGLHAGEVQDRWDIDCIPVYEYVPCPDDQPVTAADDRTDALCKKLAYEICFETNPTTGTTTVTTTGNGSGVPPVNPHSSGGGGSTTAGQNKAICTSKQIAAFNKKYGLDLLSDDEGYYEELANGCGMTTSPDAGCTSALNPDFEKCVIEIGTAGIEVEPTTDNNAISVARPVCPAVFDFKYLTNPVTNRAYTATILHNVHLVFSVPDGRRVRLRIDNMSLKIEANSNSACLAYSSQFATDAINSAVISVQNSVSTALATTPLKVIQDQARMQFVSRVHAALKTEVTNCNSAYTSDMSLLGNMFNNSENVPITDCSMLMSTQCP